MTSVTSLCQRRNNQDSAKQGTGGGRRIRSLAVECWAWTYLIILIVVATGMTRGVAQRHTFRHQDERKLIRSTTTTAAAAATTTAAATPTTPSPSPTPAPAPAPTPTTPTPTPPTPDS